MNFMKGYDIPELNGTEVNPNCRADQPLIVKDILERNDAVLTEITAELIRILVAISGEGAIKDDKIRSQDECMLNTLARQNADMIAILDIVCKIRERLW